MGKIALVDNSCKSRAAYLEAYCLPTFYMEDFSILGILVENIETASTVLKKFGYVIVDRQNSSDIQIGDAKQVAAIMTTLSQHGITAELADIADTVYQA
ncbi:MAG: hypothetical protein ACWGOX_10405 [Desulforhopalus sp.]